MINEDELKFANWMLEVAIPNGECLECHYSNSTHGYCKVAASNELAHRFIYRIKRGPIGVLWVLHTCDNRGCINPNHLWLGTGIDNTKDRHDKGRTSKHGRPKTYTDIEAQAMIEMRKKGFSYEAIAQQFMTSRESARRAINGLL